MDKGGRPTKYDAEFHNADFLRLSKQGKHIKQIALIWDIDRDTIYEWGRKHKRFSVTIKKGQALCEAWYMQIGQAAMLNEGVANGKKLNVHLGFFVWMTKNVCKWSDKIVQKGDQTSPGSKVKVVVLPQNGFEGTKKENKKSGKR